MWRHFTLSICPTKVTLGWANLHISGFKELEQLCALLTKMYALALSVMANYPVWPEVKVTISSTYKSQNSRRGNNTCNAHFKPNDIRITYPFKKAIICYKSYVRVNHRWLTCVSHRCTNLFAASVKTMTCCPTVPTWKCLSTALLLHWSVYLCCSTAACSSAKT